MQFTKLAIISFLASVGLAAPAEAGLSKRARESIHMAHCNTYYALDYYADDTKDNVFPGDSNECVSSSFHEGTSASCKFGSGVTFSWFLASNALSASQGSQVGTGNNGYHNFNCFRDDGHTLYTDGNGNKCSSTYVCFDA
ncbi:hypothetical protein F4821DRAFT_219658 [Hypoxylon rubiginosum]|uniref:Uncharacterized protein n=1 Tax=Hypoxylon rubiginosum TaxID=110542 RepID=A0ACC0CNV2_9PEZI|nr:hypothetical protein F4821DRAFT_219658 [Hypoxylon rubiginosum]